MLCKLLCKQFSRAAAKPAFSAPGFWGLSQQQETPKQQVDPAGKQCCSRLAVSPHPVPWALPKLQTVSFLPDKPQGFLTDWSQFWKGRDISNFADFRLGAVVGFGQSPACEVKRACVRVCVSPCACACLTTGSTQITLPVLFSAI